MKHCLRRLYFLMLLFGLDPRATLHTLRGLPAYLKDLWALKLQQKRSTLFFPLGVPYPCLADRFAESGTARGHYFHQDLLVARRICLDAPERHVDVGSRFDGFVAHVASFRPIEVIDIRPMTGNIPNVTFIQCDFMSPLRDSLLNYCDSLSCLHALEHFGLGRYGDAVTFDGYLLGFNNLHNMLKVGGKLYFSVPFGPQRIEFNAHRVFSMEYLLTLIHTNFRIESFSFVNDEGDLFENAELADDAIKTNYGCHYGCAIFEMTKIS